MLSRHLYPILLYLAYSLIQPLIGCASLPSREAVLRDTPAREVREAELDEYLGSGYGIFGGRKVQWATLKFSPEAARWVSAQNWHPKQRARVEKDGSYVLELPYAEDRELVMEILKYGADVEVLAPAALRKRVAGALKLAAARYD